MKKLVIAAALVLAGCGHNPVIREKPIEVKVPVAVPCMSERPTEPTPLKGQMAREEWQALNTDQRQARLSSQALSWKIYADLATAASAGCP